MGTSVDAKYDVAMKVIAHFTNFSHSLFARTKIMPDEEFSSEDKDCRLFEWKKKKNKIQSAVTFIENVLDLVKVAANILHAINQRNETCNRWQRSNHLYQNE